LSFDTVFCYPVTIKQIGLEETTVKEIEQNQLIRQQIGLEETTVKETEQNQLTWYGHAQRIALKWVPKQKEHEEDRRKTGRKV
jgi:hypothetical protein